jgi:hypothetical protein
LGGAFGSLVTGALLLLQSWLADRRARRNKAQDDRRAMEEKRSDRLLKARADWASVYQSVYIPLRRVAIVAGKDGKVPQGEADRLREGLERLHQEASRLALVEPSAPLRRLVRVLSLNMAFQSDTATADDLKREAGRIERVYGASMLFIDLLGETDPEKDLKTVTDRLDGVLTDDFKAGELLRFVLTGQPPSRYAMIAAGDGVKPSPTLSSAAEPAP